MFSFPLASFLLSSPDIIEITTSLPDVFSLLVASHPKVPPVSASNVFFASSSAILSWAALPSGSTTPSLSGAANVNFTSVDAASLSLFRGLAHFLRKCSAQRNTKFAKFDVRFFHRVEFVTSLKARLADAES